MMACYVPDAPPQEFSVAEARSALQSGINCGRMEMRAPPLQAAWLPRRFCRRWATNRRNRSLFPRCEFPDGLFFLDCGRWVMDVNAYAAHAQRLKIENSAHYTYPDSSSDSSWTSSEGGSTHANPSYSVCSATSSIEGDSPRLALLRQLDEGPPTPRARLVFLQLPEEPIGRIEPTSQLLRRFLKDQAQECRFMYVRSSFHFPFVRL